MNRAFFDTLEGANNRSLWVFLKEPDRFRLAEEVRYMRGQELREAGPVRAALLE